MPGMLTTVQDSGRWSYQGKGMPVAGAMDMQSFALGNILVGNDENAAALEVTLLGPTLSVTEGKGLPPSRARARFHRERQPSRTGLL